MLTIVFWDVVLLVVLLMFSVPLPYCFGGALLFMSFFGEVSMKSMMLWAFDQMINPVLLASPLFILAGILMGGSGIAKKLLDFVDVFIGHIKGGLGVVCCVTCAIIGAISGSGFTGVAATGPIMIPRMVEQGYPRGFATALLAVASILGLLIPPSGIMILYGWVTETSILACFLSTLMPGLLITLLLSVVNMVWARKFNLKLESRDVIRERRRELVPRTISAAPALLMPVIVLGGIYGGVFTPTESAAVGCAATLLVGLARRSLDGRAIIEAIRATAETTAMIFVILLGAEVFNACLALTQVPTAAAEMIAASGWQPYTILIGLLAFYIVLGGVMDELAMILLTLPVFFPIVTALDFGMPVDDVAIWFGILVLMSVEVGMISPPFGMNLFLINSIAKDVPIEQTYVGVLGFFAMDIARILLVLFVPFLALWMTGMG